MPTKDVRTSEIPASSEPSGDARNQAFGAVLSEAERANEDGLTVSGKVGLTTLEMALNRAIAVIGDSTEALRWMGTPVAALGHATPISLMGTEDGRQAVLDVLGRLEHGVL